MLGHHRQNGFVQCGQRLKNNYKIISLRAICHLESQSIDGFHSLACSGKSQATCGSMCAWHITSLTSCFPESGWHHLVALSMDEAKQISASHQKGYMGRFGQREQGWGGNTTIGHLVVQSQYNFSVFVVGLTIKRLHCTLVFPVCCIA